MLCVWLFCLHIYLCTAYVPDAHGGQRQAWDLLELELQILVSPQSGRWELNLSSQEEQSVSPLSHIYSPIK